MVVSAQLMASFQYVFAHQALKIYIISFRIIKDVAIAVCL